MYGVSRITSEQDIMLISFLDADVKSGLADALQLMADTNIVVDMISQSAPRSNKIDFSFTTGTDHFEAVMKAMPQLQKTPLISRGYSKINLFGEEMVTSCGVAAKAMKLLQHAGIDVAMITTSDLDISLLVEEQNEDSALTILKEGFAL